MEVVEVLDKLMDARVSAWLDREGKLRIDKTAPPELKEMVRAHKQELIEVRRAQAIMNRPGMRCLRLPLGDLAVAYPLNANLAEIRWAMGVLGMESIPLVLSDEGLKWIPYPVDPISGRRGKFVAKRQESSQGKQPQPNAQSEAAK